MRAKPEYRDRDETEVAILDALADRAQEGMTVFELRTRVDVDIDRLESALAELKADDLIEATKEDERTVIVPDEDAIGSHDPSDDPSMVERILERLPF